MQNTTELSKTKATCEDWLSFKHAFTSEIDHKINLTIVEKLQYLKSTIKGKAAQSIKTIIMTVDNYIINISAKYKKMYT